MAVASPLRAGEDAAGPARNVRQELASSRYSTDAIRATGEYFQSVGVSGSLAKYRAGVELFRSLNGSLADDAPGIARVEMTARRLSWMGALIDAWASSGLEFTHADASLAQQAFVAFRDELSAREIPGYRPPKSFSRPSVPGTLGSTDPALIPDPAERAKFIAKLAAYYKEIDVYQEQRDIKSAVSEVPSQISRLEAIPSFRRLAPNS